MRKSAKASAPGKFHLIGEHSSVYGKPVLLCAIDDRITISIKLAKDTDLSVLDESGQQAVKAIQQFIQKKYKLKDIRYAIKINSQLSVGRGLGSSAAFSSAVAAALFHLYGLKFNLTEIFEAAYAGEKAFHGNPSGGDLAVCVFGGLLWFRKETENIKLFKKLEVLSPIIRKVILVDSGKPVETTKKMVEMVANKNLLDESLVFKFNEQQEALVKILSDALIKNNSENVLTSIKKAERNLEVLGVVGEKAQKMIRKLEKNGDVAKISGGGGVKNGSGIMVVFCKNKKKTITFCRENKWEYMPVKISEEGVRIEK